MPKNKEADDEMTDVFYTLDRLVQLHQCLASEQASPSPRTGVTTALDKLETHINAILSSLNFSTEETQDEE